MLKSIQFKNFKVLRDATLPLSRFTLIVGPNGSGKSTALQGLQVIAGRGGFRAGQWLSGGLPPEHNSAVAVVLRWEDNQEGTTTVRWSLGDGLSFSPSGQQDEVLRKKLSGIRVYSLDANSISVPVQFEPYVELDEHGGRLAGVMDRLRDQDPERFEALNQELGSWFPEFDRILFDVPEVGKRAFLLRARKERYAVPAIDLSQGTLLAFTILVLAYLPNSAPAICLEEPDRGIHPRLLRQIQDALYRLSYPENFGEKREPIQVIATTHSPYFLDLYKDHPEEVVIAQKTPEGACFERLSEQPHIMEILGDAPLGEVWYSGILGGVPAEQ